MDVFTAGIDIGAATAKALILRENNILSYDVKSTGGDVIKAGKEVLEEAIRKAGISFNDLKSVVSTGYGRNAVSFSHKAITEIACHAKGASFFFENVRMVIDIGGQDSKGILVGEGGKVKDFVMNDKCAAGTGRFLEVMARVLGLKLEDLGNMSFKSKDPCQISSVCTVFAESEVVSLRAEKKRVEDIIAGIHQSIAKRVSSMIAPMGVEIPIVFTGGVAKNPGVIKALEENLNVSLTIPDEPQIIGALGAALFAREDLK